MKFPRRHFLQLATLGIALPALSKIAQAASYPSRPVRIIVGYPAGGTADILARIVAQQLSERLEQPFLVETIPGAGSNIAARTVARAAPDGYTLLLVGPANAINATLYTNLEFDFVRDIAGVATMTSVANVMQVHPSVPANSVAEFIAYTKANPGKVNYASAGIGTATHVSAELFKMMAKVDMVQVPYRGSAPAVVGLMAGQTQVMFDNVSSSIGYIRAGKLRPLAVTTATRSNALPDIPTVGDTLPGYEVNVVNGIGAPTNTPPEIVALLNREINAGLANAKVKAQLANLGFTVLSGSPADYRKLIAEETEKWAKVIRFSGAKAQ
jgi:tripartite-type tricarboxylate transporter receptor subunit TctC